MGRGGWRDESDFAALVALPEDWLVPSTQIRRITTFCVLATMVFDTSYSICNHIAIGRYLHFKNRFGGQESSVKR